MERTEDLFIKDGESVNEWLGRLDGKKKASPEQHVLKSKPQGAILQTAKLTIALVRKEEPPHYSKNANTVINVAVGEGGAAIRVFGELVDLIKTCPEGKILNPTVSSVPLLGCHRSDSLEDRMESVVRVIFLAEPEQAKAVMRDVLPLQRKDRRILAGGFQELSGELQSKVVQLTVESLEPAVRQRLAEHPLADLIITALKPYEDEVKRKIEKKKAEDALLGVL